MKRTSLKLLSIVIMLAVVGGLLIAYTTQDASSTASESGMNMSTNQSEREIDYWVAPMDPNYRRKEAGKSPMGMDLIPIYKEVMGAGDKPENVLQINPAVTNNIGVRTALVAQGTIVRPLHTVGVVVVDEEKQFDIHVRSEGWIEKLIVKSEGEDVEQGDVLFQIYSPALSTAQSEYIQAARLKRRGLMNAARARLEALGMTAKQINHLQKSGKPTQRVDIVAPQAGTVLVHRVREGMFVRPEALTMRLANLNSVWVLASIFEDQVALVAPGQQVHMIVPSAPAQEWSGTVDYIYPNVERETRTVKVRLRFPNISGDLKLNAFAKIEINAAPIENTLTVPLSAVIRTSTEDRVIVALGDGQFRPAQVRLGFEGADRVQVLAGLTLGETVVTSGQFLIDSEASLEPGLLRLIAPNPSTQKDKMNESRSGEAMSPPMDHSMDHPMSHDMMKGAPE